MYRIGGNNGKGKVRKIVANHVRLVEVLWDR